MGFTIRVHTVIRGSRYLARPPGRRECRRRDRLDARRVWLSRRILPELHDDRRVTPSGAGVVPLVRKLDKVRSAERGGDATRVLGRSSVVELARQDQGWNVAAHGGTRRRVAESGKPFLAIVVDHAPEWGLHAGVHRLAGFERRGAVVVVAVDELAQRTVGQEPGHGVVSYDLARRPRTVTRAQLVQQQGDAAQPHARPHALANASDQAVAIEPNRIAPAIR